MLKKIRNIIKNEGILGIINKCLLQILGLFLKKNEKVWVFGESCGELFFNNSKHFFLCVFKNYKNIHPIWLTKKKEIINQIREIGHEAYKINSLKALYYSSIAKVYIHSYGHLNSYSKNNIIKLIRNDFKHLETNYFGNSNKNYNKFLLKIGQIIGDRWFFSNEETICPHCGNREFKKKRGNIISRMCNGINLIIFRKNFIGCLFYLKKT